MNLRDFCETVAHTFVRNDKDEETKFGKRGKLKSCEKDSGHWVLANTRCRSHVRFSTILNTDLAANYEPVDADSDTGYSTFFDMPVEKRKQLSRCQYELVCYVPWTDHPDKTFLGEKKHKDLEENDMEAGRRYSLKRGERYAEVYKEMWRAGKVAPPGSLWHRDLQSAYTLFLVNNHNSEVKLDRSSNRGCYNALFEPAEELAGLEAEDIRPELYEEADDYDYSSAESFLVNDDLREILQQPAPLLDEIAIAYPTQTEWRLTEELVTKNNNKRFLAQPPEPRITFENLSPLQRKFVEVAVSGHHQVLYLLGKAGSGKTEVLLHICSRMKGRVQIGATTGKAASFFHGPTVHGMFGISLTDFSDSSAHIDASSKKCIENSTAYEDIDLFILDEVGMLPSHILGLLDEIMTLSFNPNKDRRHKVIPPFGGKRIIFVGDLAQLPPVDGQPFYIM
jgi:DNA replication protein DnaC